MSLQYFISAAEPIPVDPIHPAEVLRVIETRAPTANDKNFRIGTQWLNQTTSVFYGLASVDQSGATWSLLSPGASDVDTLTGDSGGAISPIAGNIDILGGTGVTVVGTAGTLTINASTGQAPVSQYVVAADGSADYTTIQAALDAADGDGGGVVVLRPGSYTEDLTLYADCAVVGAIGFPDTGQFIITGTHTPPATGNFQFRNVSLVDATTIVSSAAAGTGQILVGDCLITVTNGYAFDLANWVGTVQCWNIDSSGGTTDGFINNTGGATVIVYNAGLGAGSGNAASISGPFIANGMQLACPLSLVTGATATNVTGSQFSGGVTLANDSAGLFNQCSFVTGATASITMSSSGDWDWDQLSIDSSANPAIAGAGAGTVTYGMLTFLNGSNMAATLTTSRQETRTGTSFATTFDTDVAAAAVTLSGTTLAADGTDSNISLTLTPKGTGTVTVSTGGVLVSGGDIINTHSSASTDVTIEVTNSDNTMADSRAGVEIATGGTSSGDPYLNFLLSGGQAFTMGIDNSTANDDFVLSNNAALGTANVISIDGSSLDVSVAAGFLEISGAAKTLRVQGGAATDFVGTFTMSSGVGTVLNTNIAAGDIVLLNRTSVNSSTTIGVATVLTINVGVSFVVTSVDASASTVTDDNSIWSYFIVRPV